MMLTEVKKMEELVLNNGSNQVVKFDSLPNIEVFIYPKSINTYNEVTFFIGC